ncbi:MAG: hypothetical protein J2P23_14510, partial [Microlunatus sp.]|nr:hypothetical protein [Microlunatus sp.]
PTAVQEVDGPINGPQLLGAAADRDVSGEEQQIRDRAARRAAELEGEGDGDFLDSDYEDADEPEDEDRYAPLAPRKRRWRRPLILTLLVVLVLAVGAGSGFAWTRTQYYVGAADENVAIYQGLNTSVPGLPLSRVYEVQKLPLTDLPPYYQGMVRSGIETDTLASARATVLQLKQTAERCAAPTPPDPSTSPSHKPSKSPTAKSTAKRSPAKPKPGSRPTAKKSSSKPKPKPTPSATPTTPQATQSPAAPGQLPGDGKC